MKKLFLFLLTFAFIGLMVNAEQLNAQDYNNATYVYDGGSYLLYYGNSGTMTDSTGNYYSKACDIGMQDRSQHIYVKARTTNITGTEDVDLDPYLVDGPNVLIANAKVSTVTIDQLTAATLQTDTMTTDGYWRAYQYVYFIMDGQAGNPQTTTYWWMLIPKSDAAALAPRLSSSQVIVSTNEP